jgi:hypothetical protein
LPNLPEKRVNWAGSELSVVVEDHSDPTIDSKSVEYGTDAGAAAETAAQSQAQTTTSAGIWTH